MIAIFYRHTLGTLRSSCGICSLWLVLLGFVFGLTGCGEAAPSYSEIEQSDEFKELKKIAHAKQKKAYTKFQLQAGNPLFVKWDDNLAVPTQLANPGKPIYTLQNNSRSFSPQELAIDFVAKYQDLLAVPTENFHIRQGSKKKAERYYNRDVVRLQQFAKGIPVFGASAVLTIDGDKVYSFSGRYVSDYKFRMLSTQPTISNAHAADIAKKHFDNNYISFDNYPEDISLVWVSSNLLEIELPQIIQLCWQVMAGNNLFFISALSGDIILSVPLEYTEVTSQVFVHDMHRGIGCKRIPDANDFATECNCLNECSPSCDASAQITEDHIIRYLNYLDHTFGRNGYDNNGGEMRAFIDFDAVNFSFGCANSSHTAYIPDGNYAKFGGMGPTDQIINTWEDSDAIGHEFTHAMILDETGLVYVSQSGAIHETIADYFGMMPRLLGFDDLATDRDWRYGKNRYRNNRFLRSWINPNDHHPENECMPASMDDPCYDDYYDPGENSDHFGVHHICGVPSHAIYLFSEPSSSIEGIGLEKSQHIIYRALTSCIVETSNFNHFASCTIESCEAFNSENEHQITGEDCDTIRDAWEEVGISETTIVPSRAVHYPQSSIFPEFQVSISQPYYIVEIAVDPGFFDINNLPEPRNSQNFFSTYDYNSGHLTHISGSSAPYRESYTPSFESIRPLVTNQSFPNRRLYYRAISCPEDNIDGRCILSVEDSVPLAPFIQVARFWPNGAIIREAGTDNTFFIWDNARIPITDGYGGRLYNCWQQDRDAYIEIPSEFVSAFRSVTLPEEDTACLENPILFTTTSNPNAVWITWKNADFRNDVDEWVRRRVLSPSVIASWGLQNAEIHRNYDVHYDSYPEGPPLNIRNGTLIKTQSGSKVYVVSDERKVHIVNEELFNGLGYNWNDILVVPQDVLDGLLSSESSGAGSQFAMRSLNTIDYAYVAQEPQKQDPYLPGGYVFGIPSTPLVGGSTETLGWHAEDIGVPGDTASGLGIVDLYYTLDNWETFERINDVNLMSLPYANTEYNPIGSLDWEVPDVNTDDAMLRLAMWDKSGNFREAFSKRFSINGDAECSVGPCCSNGSYRPPTYACDGPTLTQYACPWGTSCGNDIGIKQTYRYCSGNSAECDGDLRSTDWLVHEACSYSQRCGMPAGGGVACIDDSNCGDCPDEDKCLNMGCASDDSPYEGMLFKVPESGPSVYVHHSGYFHYFPDEDCYYHFYDDFSNLECLSYERAMEIQGAPMVCRDWSFVRSEADPTIYRMQSGKLRALCGTWSDSAFEAAWGYSKNVALAMSASRFNSYKSDYPIDEENGIYPPGQSAPRCGDPGYECGTHSDPTGLCFETLNCGACPYCGDNSCNGDETCSSCPGDCGVCREIIPGYITSPSNGEVVDNQSFDIAWTQGYATDGAQTATGVLCRINSDPWDYFRGFGATSPAPYSYQHPGDTIQCKIRTRLTSDYDEYRDSAVYTWTASTTWSDVKVVSISRRNDPLPNGCSDFYVDVDFTNIGSQSTTWVANGYLHPSGGDENSPDAIEARFTEYLNPEAGATVSEYFRFPIPFPLPHSAGEYQVTIVVEDFENIGGPDRMTVDVWGDDLANPTIEHFNFYGYEGDPPEVLPGKTHYMTMSAKDEYHLDRWKLWWRESGGTWQEISLEGNLDGGCNTTESSAAYWEVPGSIPEGQTLQLLFKVWDLAGNIATHSMNVVTRSNAEPTAEFLAPLGGERFERVNNNDGACVPVEVNFIEGVPLTAISLGFTTSAKESHKTIVTTNDIPVDGHLEDCLRASYMGDDIRVFARLYDENNQSHYFYSEVITIDFPASQSPWMRPVVVAGTPELDEDISDIGYFRIHVEGVNESVSIYQKGQRTWWEGDQRYDKVAFNKLYLHPTSLAINNVETKLASYTEAAVHYEGASGSAINFLLPDDHTEIIMMSWEEEVGDCNDPFNSPCNYNLYYRDVTDGSVQPPAMLGYYEGCLFGGKPWLLNYTLSPSGNKIAWPRYMLWDDSDPRSDIYRNNGASWSKLASHSNYFRHTWLGNGKLNAIERVPASPEYYTFNHVTVNENTGAILTRTSLPDMPVHSGTTWLAYDVTSENVYFMVYEYGEKMLYLYRYNGSTWSIMTSQSFDNITYRGNAVTAFYPQSIISRNNHVFFFGQVVHEGDASTVYIVAHLHPTNTTIDIDTALTGFEYADNYATVGQYNGGRLVRAWDYCEWNFQKSLCMQRAHWIFTDCWDDNPCTTDSWNPDTGVCEYEEIECEQDGNLCNGPEACNPLSGICETDTNQAADCDDGLACTGVESCDPETGECETDGIPDLGDGYTCTLDECNEPAGNVTHTPVDDECITDLCHNSVCNPSDESSDPASGCVETAKPIPSDGISCTEDICDPSTGEISYERIEGWCLIEGQCYEHGSINPENPCQHCRAYFDPTHWSAKTEANGLGCEDGYYCTVNDVCVDGVCIGSTRDCDSEVSDLRCQTTNCDEENDQCTVQNRSDGSSCTDNNVCNGVELCQAGQCAQGDSLDCDDDIECTSDLCNIESGCYHQIDTGWCLISGLCYPSASSPNGSECLVCAPDLSAYAWSNVQDGITCNDDDICSFDDHCNGNGECIGTGISCEDDPAYCGAKRTCNGTDTCTIEYPGQEVACNDSNSCTYDDHCDGQGGCTGTELICQNDLPPCGALRSCNGTDSCRTRFPGADVSCDDEELCTHSDHCDSAGGCEGTSITCIDDPEECGFRRSCNGTDTCTSEYSPESQLCNADSNGCTHNDHCDGNGNCNPGIIAGCTEFNDQCNIGICQSTGDNSYTCAQDSASHEGDSCNDSSLCTSDEVCTSGECLGAALDCSDAYDCTEDSCNPETGECKNIPDNTACDDQNDCTEDVCLADFGCDYTDQPDWTICDQDDAYACFTGQCEELGENDTCNTAIELTANIAHDGNLDNFHAWKDGSNACSVENLAGLDAYFSFSFVAGETYSITVTPASGLDVALVGWSDCESDAECLMTVDGFGEGEAEIAADIHAEESGMLIVQVIDVTTEPGRGEKDFMILVESESIVDGDEDGDDDIETDGDLDDDGEINPDGDLDTEDPMTDGDNDESISDGDEPATDGDDWDWADDGDEAAVDGDASSGSDDGSGCASTGSNAGTLMFGVILMVALIARRRKIQLK